jgi:hypothetical protein
MNRWLACICCIFLCSCAAKDTIYYDFQSQAIVSCSGTIKWMEIEAPSVTIVIKGAGRQVYLNKQNPGCVVTLDNEQQTGYVFRSQPNATYVVRTEKGVDTGAGALTFRTDGNGKIAKASRSYCNP